MDAIEEEGTIDTIYSIDTINTTYATYTIYTIDRIPKNTTQYDTLTVNKAYST